MKSFLFLAAYLLPLFLPSPSDAQVLVTEKGKRSIYIMGESPGSTVTIQRNVTLFTPKASDSCGVIKLNTPSSGFWSGTLTINGTNIPNGSLTQVSSVPSCTGGVLTPSQSANFQDSSRNIYVVRIGSTPVLPNTVYTIGLPSRTTRTARVNGCGFARFNESSTDAWKNTEDLIIFGDSLRFSFIPTQNYPPLCRNVGTSASPTYWLYEAAN